LRVIQRRYAKPEIATLNNNNNNDITPSTTTTATSSTTTTSLSSINSAPTFAELSEFPTGFDTGGTFVI
jgi:hypothetical protein